MNSPSNAFDIYIQLAERLLDQESKRLFDMPLDDEEIAALRDPEQCFEMMDDMEARMAFDVTAAREWLTAAHSPGLADATRLHVAAEALAEFNVTEQSEPSSMMSP